MKHPINRYLVLPLTRLQQVAHDSRATSVAHALRGI
jgi:hypothetical protein